MSEEKKEIEKVMFLSPATSVWKNAETIADELNDDENQDHASELQGILLSSLQMQNVCVLSGSGTSLGDTLKGPSMKDLWEYCAYIEYGTNTDINPAFISVAKKIKYKLDPDNQNIEDFLSKCDAYQQVHDDAADVIAIVSECKNTIIKKCSFVNAHTNLDAHMLFIQRLSRRRTRDSRLKVFTTNYDLCFEQSASRLGLVIIDGFSFTQPRRYDPKFFTYDIVRRPRTGEDTGNFLEGVIQLFKLHGSVNWCRKQVKEEDIDYSIIEEAVDINPSMACLIYPAKGKYQQTYIQPHLELFAQYLTALREPNTCFIVSGFGFNDDHLSEPILSAIQSNPHLRLIITDPNAKKNVLSMEPSKKYWRRFYQLAQSGCDIWFINANFYEFAKLIPDLHSLNSAEKLAIAVKTVGAH